MRTAKWVGPSGTFPLLGLENKYIPQISIFFLGGIKLDAKTYGKFEGFPFNIVLFGLVI